MDVLNSTVIIIVIIVTLPYLTTHPFFLEKGQNCPSLKDDDNSDVTDMSVFVYSAPHTPHPSPSTHPTHPNGCRPASVESSIFSPPAKLIKVEHYFSIHEKHHGTRFKMLLSCAMNTFQGKF